MTDRARILHVIKTFSLGGAETNLLNMVEAFTAAKVENHVAYSYGGEIEERFRAAGVRLFKYAEGNHRIKSLHTLPIVLRLASYIRTNRIDVVHTHNFNAHVWGLIAAKFAGAKLVEHVHDFRYTPADELSRRHGLLDQYRFVKYFRGHSDRVVVLTREHANYVVKHRIARPDQVLEWQNGISLREPENPQSQNTRHQFDLPLDATVVLTSARMDPTKNVDLVLRIAGRVVERAPRVLFVVAGTGTHLAEYKARAREAGLDQVVRFIGFHRDMYGLLAASDIFLLPSFLELHSIAILEALKMRVPVVISKGVGCHDEFIESGRNGYLCDPFAEQPWIDALAPLVNDDALRKRIGLAGYDTCRRLFDIRNTTARFEKLYAELAL